MGKVRQRLGARGRSPIVMSKKRQRVLNPENVVRAIHLLKRLIHIDQNLGPREVALNRLAVTNKLQSQHIHPLEVERAFNMLVRDKIIIPIGKKRVLFMLTEYGHETIFKEQQ